MFKSILGTLVSFIVLDTLWIRLVAVSWYQKAVPHMLLMKDGNVTANIFPAILFYVVVIFSLVWLVVWPEEKVSRALMNGAVAGLMSYGTYALTCWALFRGFTWQLATADILWGVVLCAVSCAVGVYLKA